MKSPKNFKKKCYKDKKNIIPDPKTKHAQR